MVVGEFAEQRELIVIGGGPGGYHAAIRAAQLGNQVTLVEQDQLGGTCLHKGCIPSKIFTHVASKWHQTQQLSAFGISTGDLSLDMQELMAYKNSTIEQLRKGIEKLCQANRVEIVRGKANFINEHKLGVETEHQFTLFTFQHAIIATGSYPVLPENLKNSPFVWTEETIFTLHEIPKDLIVCGRDYIALEVAFSYRKLGAEVTIIIPEQADFPFDKAINRELKRMLKKEKIQLYRENKIKNITAIDGEVCVRISSNDQEISLTGTHLYMETEHKPNIESLGIDRIGMIYSEAGFIKVDNEMRTNIPSIFAIGNVTGDRLSAVIAMKQGKVAAEFIAGVASEIDTTMMPTVVHSIPPIAVVGLTEEEAIRQGYEVRTSQFGYSGNSYALIGKEKNGVTKIVKDAKTDLLLGFHVIGFGAIELISTGVTALELVARDEDLAFPFYPHPSFNETFLEAAEGLTNRAIHMKPS
ncbi:dihydrolipoyl dehydrogenase family protein [Virgibacillus pantothenticus]|uniref:dihydrolipoyl dehydrogenase family protein n=1 Tax=Virgibacillus pantothenticus TaxID=1473 RepID=UPI0009843E25|nr:FAD-dependent oxidoreductase [Virgibacillus pantothenticus]